MELKYGCNPHQRFAEITPIDSSSAPVQCLHGNPSFINFLDAINGFQLVMETRRALDLPAATSFKHVSPAGAAVAVPLSEQLVQAYSVEGQDLTPTALAYVRARGADPKSSFGDFVAVSETVDVATAKLLKPLVSDGIIAPGYEPEALSILSSKKKGGFIVMQGDPNFTPPARESRELFGMRLTQERNNYQVTIKDLEQVVCGELTPEAKRDLVLGLITLKYTQSNSVGYALDGQMIGIGAGQQSRVDCTKLAGSKVHVWHMMHHPRVLGLPFLDGIKRQDRINCRVKYIEGGNIDDALHSPAPALTAEEQEAWLGQLTGVSLVSDAFFPFADNIDHAARYGVRFVAQPGGSLRDDEVTTACKNYGMAMAHTGVRLFHH